MKQERIQVILTIVLGIVLLVLFPFLAIWGLQLLGVPVAASFKSWLGSALIFLFLIISNRFSKSIKK